LIHSRTTKKFWQQFEKLPFGVQQEARRAYRQFRENPQHPGLHFKKLQGHDDIYSVRIGIGYRALATMNGNWVVWFWIGSHAEYDRLA
jgi:mRNA-degrading endonuclease RelE of RelBE toxin-antitoxin system